MLIAAEFMVLGFAMIGNCLTVYTVFFKLDQIESFLTTATWIAPVKEMHRGGGLIWKLHRFALIAALFIIPSIFIKRGDIDARELSLMPRSLKWLVLGNLCLGGVTAVVAAGVYFHLRMTGLAG